MPKLRFVFNLPNMPLFINMYCILHVFFVGFHFLGEGVDSEFMFIPFFKFILLKNREKRFWLVPEYLITPFIIM